MSTYIPLEIQSEIIINLPVKSLLQFRCVSKQWKSLIDGSEFIKNYHINRINPQHHLLVWGDKVDIVQTFTSIIDDNTFPQRKFRLTAPGSVNFLRDVSRVGYVDGLLCFFGSYGDVGSNKMMAVIWNPSIRKSVNIVIPNVMNDRDGDTALGFGVCPYTSDPKLVKINVNKIETPYTWVVAVFTFSTRVWRTVYSGALLKSCTFMWNHVSIDGIIYWRTAVLDEKLWSNCIISFHLEREKFGEVSLSERLIGTNDLVVAKVNESLGLLEYYIEGEIWVCDVWTKKDGVYKPFTKLYTVKVEGNSCLYNVLSFRHNGEVVLEMDDDDDNDNDIGYVVQVYEPSSRYINGVGINGNYARFSTVSYIETLLLLHESNSIIH